MTHGLQRLLWSCLRSALGLKNKGGKNTRELTQNELNGRRLVTQRGITLQGATPQAQEVSRRSPESSGINSGAINPQTDASPGARWVGRVKCDPGGF